jgi:hypothetical protein
VKRLGAILMALGALLGVAVFLAVGAHWGYPGAGWLLNVALAKLSLVGAGGLMGGGAALQRVARREEMKRLGSRPAA